MGHEEVPHVLALAGRHAGGVPARQTPAERGDLMIAPFTALPRGIAPRGGFFLFIKFIGLLLCGNGSLCSGQAGDGHAVRRAGNIIQPHFFTEANAGRIAAMFAANAQL